MAAGLASAQTGGGTPQQPSPPAPGGASVLPSERPDDRQPGETSGPDTGAPGGDTAPPLLTPGRQIRPDELPVGALPVPDPSARELAARTAPGPQTGLAFDDQAAKPALGSTLWSGLSCEGFTSAMAGLWNAPSSTNPALTGFLRRVLLAQAAPPEGCTTEAFAQARACVLRHYGYADDAAALSVITAPCAPVEPIDLPDNVSGARLLTALTLLISPEDAHHEAARAVLAELGFAEDAAAIAAASPPTLRAGND